MKAGLWPIDSYLQNKNGSEKKTRTNHHKTRGKQKYQKASQ